MTEIQALEARIALLEAEVAQLKKQNAAPSEGEQKSGWLYKVAGIFKDCPEFDEVIRLGEEWREADRKAAADANYE